MEHFYGHDRIRSKYRRIIKLKISIVVALLLMLNGCDMSANHGGWTTMSIPESFSSNGERIYFTGVSQSGNPITTKGGGSLMSMHGQMHGGGVRHVMAVTGRVAD